MNRQYFGLLLCSVQVLLAANAEECRPVSLTFVGKMQQKISGSKDWVDKARNYFDQTPELLFTELESGTWNISRQCGLVDPIGLQPGEGKLWLCDFNLTYLLPTFDYASSLEMLFPEVTVPNLNTSLNVLKKELKEVLENILTIELPGGGFLAIMNSPLPAEGTGRHTDGLPPEANCSVTAGFKQLQDTVVNDANVNEVVVQLERLTSKPMVLTSTDITISANTLRKLTEGSPRKKEVGVRIAQTINNLMNADTTHLARAEQKNGSATRILKSLEEYSLTADLGGDQQQIQRNDITLQMWDVSEISDSTSGFCHMSDGEMINCESIDDENVGKIETAIIMSEEAKQQVQKYHEDQKQEKIRMAFVLQKKANLFLSPSQLKSPGRRSDVDGEIMALKLPANYSEQVKGNIWTIFRPQENKTGKAICVHWDFNAADGHGDWSTDGCSTNSTEEGRIVCQCNHLTNFAVLTGSTVDHTALSVITYIGLGVSSICLLLTIITFLVFRKKLHFGHGQKVLVNLAAALLCVNVIFLAGIERTENEHVCVAMAALLHYLLLVAFAWMLVEAVLQYLRLVKVIGAHVERFMLKAALPSWSLPAVLVIVFLCVQYIKKYKLYQNSELCWLEEYPMYFAFMLPIGVIILINTALYIRIIKSITCDRSENLRSTQSKSDLTKLQVFGSLSVFVLLGLTWVFGFLTIKGVTSPFPIFDYVFCILNSFQGFFIFLFHTFRNKQIRDSWYKLVCPSRYNRREAKKKKSDLRGKQSGPSVLTIETTYKTHSYTTTA